MGICEPFNLKTESFSALEVSMCIYICHWGAMSLIDTRAPGRRVRGAALYVVHCPTARAKMMCTAPGIRIYKVRVGNPVFFNSGAISPEPRQPS